MIAASARTTAPEASRSRVRRAADRGHARHAHPRSRRRGAAARCRRGPARRLRDVGPPVDVVGRVVVPVALRHPGRERHVGRDLPERHERAARPWPGRRPARARPCSQSGRRGSAAATTTRWGPTRSAGRPGAAPPRCRSACPGPGPRRRTGRCGRRRTTGSHSGDAALAIRDELAPQLVEVRRPGPQHAVRAVLDVVQAAERGLPAERAQALAEDVAAAGGRRPAAATTRRRPRRTAPGRRPSPWSGRRGRTSSWAGRSTASPTIAVSPLNSYSSESLAAGSTQPVPVVVTTTRTLRSKPPARSQLADGERRTVADVRGAWPARRRRGPAPSARRPEKSRELLRASGPSRRSCVPAGRGRPTAPGTPGCRTARAPSGCDGALLGAAVLDAERGVRRRRPAPGRARR